MDYLFITALFVIFIMLICMPLYLHMKNNNYTTGITLFVKGISTLIAALFSIYGLYFLSSIKTNEASKLFSNNWWVAIGLMICVLADVLLNIYFYIGGILFFLGHICYLIFFLKLSPFSPISIPVYAIVLALCLCYFYKFHIAFGREKYLCAIYGATISASFAISVLLPFHIGSYGLFPALGGGLLFISDILLARNMLVKETSLSDAVALSFYYTGQLLMAFSVYLPAVLAQIT